MPHVNEAIIASPFESTLLLIMVYTVLLVQSGTISLQDAIGIVPAAPWPCFPSTRLFAKGEHIAYDLSLER